MAGPPRYPASTDLHAHVLCSTTSESNAPITPRAASVEEDDSDTESVPTPTHSVGGPQYDDLPPSYDEAREQAVHDLRSGVAPVDPSHIEAHRLTLSEDPNGPEIWEYRVRGEHPDDAADQERAPEYDAHASPLASTVPVQHVHSSESIPVGRIGSRNYPSMVDAAFEALLNAALQFTQHEPDVDMQNVPRLVRRVAVPQDGFPGTPRGSNGNVQFLRAYAKVLHMHSIRPAEFAEFIDGLNAICLATGVSNSDLLSVTSRHTGSWTAIRSYLDGANEAFFVPRGLKVSIHNLSDLLQSLNIPPSEHQRRDARLRVLDSENTSIARAEALHPWIEALDSNVPEPSAHVLAMQHMSEHISNAHLKGQAPSHSSSASYEDPPHSVPDEALHDRTHQSSGVRGLRGNTAPWSPFSASNHGIFGASGSRPSGPPHHGRGSQQHHGGRSAPNRPNNEWATLGQDIGKWGEEFGKRMGQWGEQLGRDAGSLGQEVGRRASLISQDMSARANGSNIQRQNVSSPIHDTSQGDLPPSYAAGQESGIVTQDQKNQPTVPPPAYESSKGKAKAQENYDDDDSSSISSDSSDSSDSDSDSDSDLECSGSPTKRNTRREIKRRGRDLKHEHRQHKRDLRALHDQKRKGKGKGKGKANKTKEWKDAKKQYKEKKGELKKESVAARKAWKEEKYERKKMKREERREGKSSAGSAKDNEGMQKMLWIVIENVES
ncbi:hypothetical protein ACN47E_005498 [Coniothyrium glycines]